MIAYADFIKEKVKPAPECGFELPLEALNPASFGQYHQYQPHVVQWALQLGKAAIFSSYGTGKARMILEWLNQVQLHTNQPVLCLAPLLVAHQTEKEAQKFNISGVRYCREPKDIQPSDRIVVTNYEIMHKFDLSVFSGVACDESAIAKNYMGKTKRALVEGLKDTRFKLLASANPSPNDLLELLNQAELLGLCQTQDALQEYFQNDTMKAGGYFLKPYAKKAFWRWVASWAVLFTKPSDIGFSDEGWQLPGLECLYHPVDIDFAARDAGLDENGQFNLVPAKSLTATGVHKEQRLNIDRLAPKVAEIVATDKDNPWVVWCFTDYEADAIAKLIPEAVNLKGSDSNKAQKIEDFLSGKTRVLITKPAIAGLGLNFQHCHNAVFLMGTSYSFEQWHQAIFRLYRFGQMSKVTAHHVYASVANSVVEVIKSKLEDFETMQKELSLASREAKFLGHSGRFDDYDPRQEMILPAWLKSA